tara:strand:+ start:173 stop:673 length:501 start_codon:yes stop_codon:yes gene_type:complete
MKYRILIFLCLFFTVGSYAQEGLKAGLQGGMPFDDFNDDVSLTLGLDVGYMWALGEVVDAGITLGFINGFPETFHSDIVREDLPHVQFVPLAASVRIWAGNSFSFGIDGGQALGINKDNEGGIYYRPQIGYLVDSNAELNLSYTAIELDSKTWTTLNVGLLYTFTF